MHFCKEVQWSKRESIISGTNTQGLVGQSLAMGITINETKGDISKWLKEY